MGNIFFLLVTGNPGSILDLLTLQLHLHSANNFHIHTLSPHTSSLSPMGNIACICEQFMVSNNIVLPINAFVLGAYLSKYWQRCLFPVPPEHFLLCYVSKKRKKIAIIRLMLRYDYSFLGEGGKSHQS